MIHEHNNIIRIKNFVECDCGEQFTQKEWDKYLEQRYLHDDAMEAMATGN